LFVSENGFVDYYELLQLSSNADTDTIERVFRHLAKKLHPDNKETADPDRFRLLVEAHRTLSNPETRAGYDIKYKEYWESKWRLASEAGSETAFGNDREIRESLLSLLYVQRRRNPRHPGLSDFDMSRLLDRPYELVEFHVWYLKAKGWVERLDTGQLAISAPGVDQVEKSRLRLGSDHLLTDGSEAPEGPEGPAPRTGAAEVLLFPKGTDINR
jgi:curved DNA-binding protein